MRRFAAAFSEFPGPCFGTDRRRVERPSAMLLLLLVLSASAAPTRSLWDQCDEDIMHADTSEQRFGIWAHAWGSDPALGPIILQCAYDWAVDDSRSRPYVRLEFADAIVIDQLIGAEIASTSDDQPPELPYTVDKEVWLELEQCTRHARPHAHAPRAIASRAA